MSTFTFIVYVLNLRRQG